MTSASYWAHAFDNRGQTREFMWNCEACPAVGIERSESDVVQAMNAHMADEHSDSEYVAPPVPE